MNDLVEVLEMMLQNRDNASNPRDLLLDMGDRIVRSLVGVFGVQQDEVAILLLSTDNKHLRFVAPRLFADLGTIPVTKRDSIAVSVLSKKAGEAVNNVRMVKHVAFFESVKLRDRAVPIQKMISVPIMVRGQAVGAAQISRKGETPQEAGPDFNEGDVRRAEQVFEVVGPLLFQARPDKF